MNDKGKGSGMALILILIVALIVAWLAVKQMGSLGKGAEVQQDDAVEQAQEVVDQINQNIQQAGQEP